MKQGFKHILFIYLVEGLCKKYSLGKSCWYLFFFLSYSNLFPSLKEEGREGDNWSKKKTKREEDTKNKEKTILNRGKKK